MHLFKNKKQNQVVTINTVEKKKRQLSLKSPSSRLVLPNGNVM